MFRIAALCWLAIGLAPAPLAAQTPGQATLATAFDRFVAERSLAAAALVVLDRNGILFERSAGTIGLDRPVPIASASKWLSAALVMTLVDEGRLTLDTTVGTVLPAAPDPIRTATVRQLLSHMAGSGGAEIMAIDDVRSVADSVDRLFANGFAHPPGQSFAYGGASMQIAGRMAEVASNLGWTELFDRRLAQPLGFSGHRWGWLRRNGAGDVPLVAGGLTLSARDYARFLRMILNDGMAEGGRVLSPSAVREMERDQVGALPIRFAPASTPANWRYGLGLWCESRDARGNCLVSSSAGAFGAFPWVDRTRGIAGVLIVLSRLDRTLDGAIALRRQAAESVTR